MNCPHCQREIPDTTVAQHFAARGGSARSKAKTLAARRNARIGALKRKETLQNVEAVAAKRVNP